MSHDHPYMPLYLGDLLKQTVYWSGEERSLLILLQATQWWNGPLPLDLASVATAIQYDAETFFTLWNRRVHTLFVETNEGYVNQETEERRRAVARMSGARRAAGKASGQARRSRAGNSTGERTAEVLFEQNSEQDARTKPPTTERSSARTPIQSNPIQSKPDQEPKLSDLSAAGGNITSAVQPSGADPPPAAPATARANGHGRAPPRQRRIPADYPTEPLRDWASKHAPGVNFDEQIALLRDHEFRDPHSDWDAVVRNWLRRAAKEKNRYGGERLTSYERHKRRLFGDA